MRHHSRTKQYPKSISPPRSVFVARMAGDEVVEEAADVLRVLGGDDEARAAQGDGVLMLLFARRSWDACKDQRVAGDMAAAGELTLIRLDAPMPGPSGMSKRPSASYAMPVKSSLAT